FFLHSKLILCVRSCFDFLFIGKYRTCVNRSKAISQKFRTGKLLVAVSGGPSSTAMLNLTAAFMSAKPHEQKKIHVFAEAFVCHIDETALFPNNECTSEKFIAMMNIQYPNFKSHCDKLEDIFDPSYTESGAFDELVEVVNNGRPGYEDITAHLDSVHKKEMSNAEKLRAIFDGIDKLSAKEDIYWHLKMSMLYHRAKKEKCDFIFLGESSTRQAIKMISMTSKGRGFSAALDVGVENSISYKDVAVIRPMKDMLGKEIAYYNRNHGIAKNVMQTTNFTTKATSKSSIERLTEEFITGLDRDFPSTVSTVSRTASKLTVHSEMDVNDKCAICLMPIQAGITGWRDRITVTTLGDKRGTDKKVTSDGECCGSAENADGCCSNKSSNVSNGQVIPFFDSLCYSCQVDARDYRNGQFELPPYVAETIKNKERDERLRQQVQEFLLSDDENQD
ncbi:hypothetical protein INT43_003792, partial [Umbelopsis isabellina]